ncbi:hypothetical protein [Saccharothrix sp. S26]|nr:hypothetical protein [Saccharothrix sp. S26]
MGGIAAAAAALGFVGQVITAEGGRPPAAQAGDRRLRDTIPWLRS